MVADLVTVFVFWSAAALLTSRVSALGAAEARVADSWRNGSADAWIPLLVAVGVGVVYGFLQAWQVRSSQGRAIVFGSIAVNAAVLGLALSWTYHIASPSMAASQGLGAYAEGVGILVLGGVIAASAAFVTGVEGYRGWRGAREPNPL
jgi:hypothetical protein